jgi:hypothetical protein
MASPVRSVHVLPRDLGDRTVLVVADDFQRSFDFGERVYVVDDAGGEKMGVVTWDPVARWVVRIEDRGTRRTAW